MKKLQNYLEYLLVLLVSTVINRLPWKWALAFGRGLGYFCFYIVPIRKKVTLENLRHALPERSEEARNRIARDTYVQFGQTIIEFMLVPNTSSEALRQRVRFEPTAFIECAKSSSCGAICMSGHFGNWELMAAAISDAGIPMSALVKEQRNPLVDHFIARTRTKKNIETFPLGIAVRGFVKALREKKFVAVLGDQDAHREGVFINFMGRPASTAKGAAILALKTGAPMHFGAAVREPDGTHTIYLETIDHSDLNGVTEEN
ncbi:hypothetical protein GX408_06025, partial [bacterium]|nr:hypothetical protein [bacterium]